MISNLFKIFTKHNSILLMSLFVGLAGCSGGDSDPVSQIIPVDPPVVEPTSQSITGGAIKGPLTNAIVTVYAFDATQPGFKGAVVGTGVTDDSSAITGLSLPLPLDPPYIMEFTSNADTRDMTTNALPVITTMRTVITQELLDSGEPIYATPLTTMAVDIAVSNADSNIAPFTGDNNGETSEAEFLAALPIAAAQVVSTVGFGMSGDLDIFDLPPLVDNTTVTETQLSNVAAYRTAIEALTAIVYGMETDALSGSVDTMFEELIDDLSTDGIIDGNVSSGASTIYTPNSLNLFATDPATLLIPNTTIPISEIELELAAEVTTTGTTTETTLLTDGTINPVIETAEINSDEDSDFVPNAIDNCPVDANTDQTNTDGLPDGGDVCDNDDDEDGLSDTEEAALGTNPLLADTDTDTVGDAADNCPVDANTDQTNTDGLTDGGDACDSDDDEDGTPDVSDAFPLNPAEDTDTDNDTVGDNADNCPVDANTNQTNTDGVDDGGDACDTDDDNDGVIDSSDYAPLNPNACSDLDADSCDDCSVGTDNFGPLSDQLVNNDGLDSDADGACNVGDADDDNDGLTDAMEAILGTNPLLADTDTDTVGDAADNCPLVANTNQTNTDGLADGGDACDTDDDNDGLTDAEEAALGTNPLLVDTDSDGVNDNVDAFPTDPAETVDTDTDGIGDVADNCPAVANPLQTNTDGLADGGDACDTDDDEDGLTDTEEATLGTNPLLADTDTDTVSDAADNCPLVVNTNQTNTDGLADGGDACDVDDDEDGLTDTEEATLGTNPLLADTDSDGVNDNVDVFPLDPAESADTDTDGIGDAADNCPAVTNPLQTNTDNAADGGDACDTDDDNDGLTDAEEAVLGTNPLLVDTDSDGVNDNVDAFPLDPIESVDTDTDGIGDVADNCPAVANPLQTNTDNAADGGDACDADDDNDGLTDVEEAALGTNPLLADTDGDGANDLNDAFPLDPAESLDTDTDGIGDVADNCPAVANPSQTNTDGLADGGDACDTDDDNDGLTDDDEINVHGTNPLVFDTDTGGEGDGSEVSGGRDPLDPNDDVVGAAPIFGSSPILDAQQGTLYSYSIAVSDDDTDDASLSLSDLGGLPAWLTLDAPNRELKGTPGNDDVGDHFISLQVDDGVNFVQQDFTITVTNVNDAPTITSVLPSTTLAEGDAFSYTVTASDIDDGDQLAFSISALPSWLSFNPGTGVLSNTATAVIGNYPITITVTDDGTVPSILSATQSFTIVVNAPGDPIDMSVLMSANEGGAAGIDEGDADEYDYWTDTFDSGSGLFSFKDYSYNHSTGTFDIFVNNNDLILDAGQWKSVGNVYATDDGNGGFDLSLRDVANDNAELASFKLTARALDIGGELIANYLDAVWQGAMDVPDAVFNQGAKLITEYRFEPLTTEYWLYIDDGCMNDGTSKYVDLNNDCNSVNVTTTVSGYAEVLSDVKVSNANKFVDTDDGSTPQNVVYLAWEGSKTLAVQIVNNSSGSTGSANYFLIDWSAPDNASRVVAVGNGAEAWVQNSDSGVAMIQFEVPASMVAVFPGDLDEATKYFLTVHNGFVRRGQIDEAGNAGSDRNLFNGNAMTDVLNNFKAPVVTDFTGIVGTWVSEDISSNGDPIVMHFFAWGYYEASGTCDADNSEGMEYGTFTQEGVVIPTVATMGACGIAAGVANGNTVVINGDVMTITVPGVGDYIYNRLKGTANPIVGSWIQGDIDSPGEGHIIVTFLDDSNIMTSQDCVNEVESGFEFGAYSWGGNDAGPLTANLSVDTNGGCGFSGLPADATATASDGLLTITIPGEGDIYFNRHSPAAASALSCGYTTSQGSFNSFTDFEAVVADCGGTTPISSASVVGTWEEDGSTEGAVFNADSSGGFTDNGSVFATFTWSIEGNMIIILDDGFNIMDVWAITPSGMKFYGEGIADGADLIRDDVKDGSIWAGNFVKQTVALTCDSSSGWDDTLNQPLNFYSYDDFETVVADCGTAVALSDADMIGTWIDTYTEPEGVYVDTLVFIAGGNGTFTTTLDGSPNESGTFAWSVSGNRYYITGEDLGVVTYREVGALLSNGSQKVYSEDAYWVSSPDLNFDSNADGEIWTGNMVKQ